VLYREVIELISEFKENIGRDQLQIADCTFGGGGHSKAILDAFPNSSILGLDLDPQTIKNAQDELKTYI